MSLRVVVVDDEPLARRKLLSMLGDAGDVAIDETCADGRGAVAAIERHRPDVVFLDIQMPELDGFEVLESLDGPVPAAVVFVTAYDRYAVRAFEVAAADYLLKPFDRERFDQALNKVRARIAGAQPPMATEDIAALRRECGRSGAGRILVRTEEGTHIVALRDLTHIEAAGNYACLHVAGEAEPHVIRRTMQEVEQRLDPARFARIHRSAIVNVERVVRVVTGARREPKVILDEGTELPVGRTHWPQLQRRLGEPL